MCLSSRDHPVRILSRSNDRDGRTERTTQCTAATVPFMMMDRYRPVQGIHLRFTRSIPNGDGTAVEATRETGGNDARFLVFSSPLPLWPIRIAMPKTPRIVPAHASSQAHPISSRAVGTLQFFIGAPVHLTIFHEQRGANEQIHYSREEGKPRGFDQLHLLNSCSQKTEEGSEKKASSTHRKGRETPAFLRSALLHSTTSLLLQEHSPGAIARSSPAGRGTFRSRCRASRFTG